MKRQFFVIVLGITAALSTPYAASADLIFDASLGGVAGSGLGTVATILTIQSPGSTTTESGSVSRSGGADVKSDTGVLASGGTTNVGNVKTGASQTLTQTFGGNGITKASQIAIVFNADEPSGNSVTLTGLQLSVFNGNTDIFDAHLAASVTFPTTFTGIGNQGFVFRLNTSQRFASASPHRQATRLVVPRPSTLQRSRRCPNRERCCSSVLRWWVWGSGGESGC